MSKASRKLNMRDKVRKRGLWWKRTVSALSLIVVFCTVYALVLPAITLSEDPICGQQVHEHTDSCYRTQIRESVCAAAEHIHDQTCVGELENPACGFGERILHSHDGRCYDQTGQLICRLTELQEHVHGEACMVTEQKLTCPLEEIPPHMHNESCYENKTVLVCQETEQLGHTHTDECYRLAEEPSCGLEHEHDQSCFPDVLICTQEEIRGHTHLDSCYELQEYLICTEETPNAHTHGEACYEILTTVTCEREQIAEHLHTPSCFNEAGERVCGLISGVVHVHDETCFKVIHLDEPELICSLPEHIHVDACYLDADALPPVRKDFYCEKGAHEHTESCYDSTGALVCTIPLHKHDVSCKVPDYDPQADVETKEDWEAPLRDISLTGRWATDLLTVAATQVGYRESKQNVIWYEDDTVKGYTRYGEWYGAPYMDWSAAFVSFCMEYANISGMPQESSCESYRNALEEMDLLREPVNYLPKPGDLVLLDTDLKDQETKSDRMGIVFELLRSDSGELTSLKVLVADADDEVKYLTYDLLSSMIIGYGELPEGDRRVLLCDQDHEHSNSCYGYKLYYTDDFLDAQLLIQGVEALPVDVTLQINRVTSANDPAGYSSMIMTMSNWMEQSPYYMGDASFYQMQLLQDGVPYQLSQEATAVVDVSFHGPVFAPDAIEGAVKIETFQLHQNPNVDLTQSIDLDDDGESAIPTDLYLVDQVREDTYENTSDGLTGIGFESDAVTTFAVVLSRATKTGQFWERVFSASEITSGGTYMIVSAEGNYALRGENNNNYTAVTIHAQKGEERPDAAPDANPERNTRYYTIVQSNGNAVDNKLFWTITASGSNYTIKNRNTNVYLCIGSVQTGTNWWGQPSYSNQFMHTNSATLTMAYKMPEQGWRISNGNNFLRNTGAGAFTYNSSNDGQYNNNAVYYYSRDMLIFKLSDVTELEIPDDVINRGDGTSEGVQGPAKPDYGEFIVPTASLEGKTELTKDDVTVKGQYYSDPSTSDIETQFRQDSYEASKVIDGKVVTDKSVIYGADDYGAFDHYDPNTFSVALSALGQEYEIPFEHRVRTPVDVVFILDVSGSMTSNSTTQGENPNRVVDLCKAVNAAITQIMDDHEANRVGVSIYSSGAWEMLPLDRYTANNNEFFVTQTKKFNHSPTNYAFTINYLLGSNSLRNSAGASFANAGSSAVQGIGTYTQAGIAMGNEIFEAIEDDTTYTATIGEGVYQRTYKVKRQPVFILVSDGEPTHSTSIYNDVLKGPHYGSGNSDPSTNGKGIHGYYTILSANYYKRAVSIQYEKEAMFYSIGMGIHETEDGPLVSTGKTGDNYKRAVLNPQSASINSLTSGKNPANTTEQLKKMLLSTYTDNTVKVLHDWPEQWYGIPHAYEPVLQPNPYAEDYEYADGAYFGDLPESELKKIFQEIYQSSMTYTTYGFILYKNSSVDILDRIGQGMEIKGVPVLRYAGINHADPEIKQDGNVTTYVYKGIYKDPYISDREADLSHISVTVTANADGTQTVEMYIYDMALPTYTPELIARKYYYEELPVRLIYQVGLTEEAEKEILALNQTGGELVYYTSQWHDQNGQEDQSLISTAVLLPSTENPFYYHIDGTEAPYKPHHTLKSENTTTTVDYHVDCHREIHTETGEVLVMVVHKQGNNGKLVFKADTVSIPVEKQWHSDVNADIMNPVELLVYQVTETTDTVGQIIRTAQPITTLTLSSANSWKAVAQGLPAPDGLWYYAVAEKIPSGYTAYYAQPTVSITVDGSQFFEAVKYDGSQTAITVTNVPAVKLPATGGAGTLWYTLGGLLLIIAAVILWYKSYLICRREEEVHP